MIVVGAGIIGLACAWRLARGKIQVTVFDRGAAGGEASWAGAGMLAPGGEMDEASPLTQMAMCGLAMYPAFVESLREASGVAIDYQSCGAVEVARSEAEAEALDRRAARQAALGIRSERVSHPAGLARFYPGARFYPDDALVNPRDIMAALRIACVRSGVVIREREPVMEIFHDSAGVRTSAGVYRDDGVLLAAGAWSSDLIADLPLAKTKPVRGHLIAYRAQAGMLSTILRHGHTYLLQRDTGTLIAGTSTEHAGFDRTIDENIVQDIHRRASGLMPALGALDPVERWNGFRPGIEGGVPVIGKVEDKPIWTAFGHYRNGILLAPDTARRIEEMITGATY
jgi:glycine oxidase